MPDGDGTILRLRHSGLRTDANCQFLTWGWDLTLDRLVIVAEGGDPSPDPLADLSLWALRASRPVDAGR
jgi:hypothetical protein